MVKKKRLLWIKILTGIVVVGTLLAGGYFSAKYFRKEPGVVLPTVTPTSITTPTVVATPVDITEWRKYTNTKYGYSFRYPESFQFSQPLGAYLSNAQSVSGGMGSIGLSIIANYNELENRTDSKTCFEATIGPEKSEKDFDIILRKIGNIEVGGYGSDHNGIRSEIFFLNNPNDGIFLIGLGFNSSQEASTVVDAILGTFKFTK